MPGSRRLLTEGIPGTGGRTRVELEDFEVEEIPLYPASGTGEHVILEIEKRGVSTREAVHRIAGAIGINPESFGVAGLKDARAVARQRVSIAGADPGKLLGLHVPNVRIVSAERHTNKLRTGHLAGNRFRIRVRDVAEGAAENARAALELLSRRGVPNRFGRQRFGERGDGHLAGAALVRGEDDEFLSLVLGRPSEKDPPAVRRSREAYGEGDLDAAVRALPRSRREERRCLVALARGKRPAQAVRAFSKRLRLFLISALQSHLFNQVLDARMPDVDRLEGGDLAWKHDSGAVFRVPHGQEDVEAENERAARFEVSPSGPMFGYRMTGPEGRPREIEAKVLSEAGLSPEDFRRPPLGRPTGGADGSTGLLRRSSPGCEGRELAEVPRPPSGRLSAEQAGTTGGADPRPAGLKVKGARRPLRVPLMEADVTEDGPHLVIAFALPPGSYASVVMEEVMKT